MKLIAISTAEYHLVCSECVECVGRFRLHDGQVLYQALLDDSFLFDREFTERTFALLRVGDIAGLDAWLGKVRCDKVSDDASQRYAVGQVFTHGIEAFCPDCQELYCKTHYQVRAGGGGGYGGVARGTCPHGHERELFSDYMSC